jgi:hypothetical protein
VSAGSVDALPEERQREIQIDHLIVENNIDRAALAAFEAKSVTALTVVAASTTA